MMTADAVLANNMRIVAANETTFLGCRPGLVMLNGEAAVDAGVPLDETEPGPPAAANPLANTGVNSVSELFGTTGALEPLAAALNAQRTDNRAIKPARVVAAVVTRRCTQVQIKKKIFMKNGQRNQHGFNKELKIITQVAKDMKWAAANNKLNKVTAGRSEPARSPPHQPAERRALALCVRRHAKIRCSWTRS